MHDYREKIIRAESDVSRLVEQLGHLESKTKALHESGETLTQVSSELNNLIRALSELIAVQSSYITSLKGLNVYDLVKSLEDEIKKNRRLTVIAIVSILLSAAAIVTIIFVTTSKF